MSAAMFMVLWKGGLMFGLPIAFASWELYQLSRMRLADEAKAQAAAASDPQAPASGAKAAAKVKALEPA